MCACALLLSQRCDRRVAADAAVAAAVVVLSGVAGVIQADDIIWSSSSVEERVGEIEIERAIDFTVST